MKADAYLAKILAYVLEHGFAARIVQGPHMARMAIGSMPAVTFDVPYTIDGSYAGYDTCIVTTVREARQALGY